jgi:hypothetical protein
MAWAEREWRQVRGTRDWVLVDVKTDTVLRHITVREPSLGELGGTKCEVTGEGHGHTVHESLEDAWAAADASLG